MVNMPNEPVSPTLVREVKAAYDRGLRKGWLREQAGYADAATFSRICAGTQSPGDTGKLLKLLAAMQTSAETSAVILAEVAASKGGAS